MSTATTRDTAPSDWRTVLVSPPREAPADWPAAWSWARRYRPDLVARLDAALDDLGPAIRAAEAASAVQSPLDAALIRRDASRAGIPAYRRLVDAVQGAADAYLAHRRQLITRP